MPNIIYLSIYLLAILSSQQNLLAGQSVLNDNNWHTIRFSRRASNLRLQVDGAPPVRGMLCMYQQHIYCPTTCRAVSFFFPKETPPISSLQPDTI